MNFKKNVVADVEVEETNVVEAKGFHPIQTAKNFVAAHPRMAKIGAGVVIGLTAAGATLAVLGKKHSEDEIDWVDLDETSDNDEIFDESVAQSMDSEN